MYLSMIGSEPSSERANRIVDVSVHRNVSPSHILKTPEARWTEELVVSLGSKYAVNGVRIDIPLTFAPPSPPHSLTSLRIKDPESYISRVPQELVQTFGSASALHNKRFQFKHITLENAEFTYLSACHTTVGDEESPDEVIHLAFVMHLVVEAEANEWACWIEGVQELDSLGLGADLSESSDCSIPRLSVAAGRCTERDS